VMIANVRIHSPEAGFFQFLDAGDAAPYFIRSSG
jgi:hypothetical protein